MADGAVGELVIARPGRDDVEEVGIAVAQDGIPLGGITVVGLLGKIIVIGRTLLRMAAKE